MEQAYHQLVEEEGGRGVRSSGKRPVTAKIKYLVMFGLITWIFVTFLDFFQSEKRLLRLVTPVGQQNRLTERLLLSQGSSEVPVRESSKVSSEVLSNLTFQTKITDGENEDEDFNRWWRGQISMKTRISSTCAKFGDSVRPRVDRKNFIYDAKHNLLYCRIAKVGTTTWLSHFLSLSELPQSSKTKVDSSPKLHAKVPPLFKVKAQDQDIGTLAQSTISFSMVRHPFERLVSAYQDKVVDGADPSYIKVRKLLKRRYGGKSFTSFLNMVLDKSRSKCRSLQDCTLDVHWLPYISRCAFCDVPYTVIARSETFSEDVKFISKLSGVSFPEMGEQLHTSSGGSTRDKAKMYFSQVNLSLARKLYEMYQADFEMFDYSPDEFLQLAVNDESKL